MKIILRMNACNLLDFLSLYDLFSSFIKHSQSIITLFTYSRMQFMRGNRQNIFQNSSANRLYEYERRHNQSDNKCKYCQENHFQANKCYVNCLYCYSRHLKKNMINGICPKMVPHAQEQQKKKSFVCNDCAGDGRFEKIIEMVHRQTEKSYQKRVKQFSNSRGENLQSLSQSTIASIPQRLVFKTQKKVQEIQCSRCSGKGRIYRLKECCKGGCQNCNYDQYVINPVWVQQRMKIQQHKQQQSFQCAICMQEVTQGKNKFVLECKHEFHRQCISKWLVIHQKCPICRQVDPYIDILKMKQFQSQEIDSQPHEQEVLLRGQNPVNLQLNESQWSSEMSLGLELSNLTIPNIRFASQQQWQ